MPKKGMPATYREWMINSRNARQSLDQVHLRDQLGRKVACPTGDASTCPQCRTIEILESGEAAAFDFIKAQGYDVSKLPGYEEIEAEAEARQPDPASELSTRRDRHQQRQEQPEGVAAEV